MTQGAPGVGAQAKTLGCPKPQGIWAHSEGRTIAKRAKWVPGFFGFIANDHHYLQVLSYLKCCLSPRVAQMWALIMWIQQCCESSCPGNTSVKKVSDVPDAMRALGFVLSLQVLFRKALLRLSHENELHGLESVVLTIYAVTHRPPKRKSCWSNNPSKAWYASWASALCLWYPSIALEYGMEWWPVKGM